MRREKERWGLGTPNGHLGRKALEAWPLLLLVVHEGEKRKRAAAAMEGGDCRNNGERREGNREKIQAVHGEWL